MSFDDPTSSILVKLSECDEFIGPKRSKHSMVTYNDTLVVFGGDNGKNMINDLITYDCKNSSWGRALNNSPPSPRYHHSAVVYKSSMFVFGGYTIDSSTNLCNKNDLYEYRFGSGTWHLWQPDHGSSPTPRSAHSAIVYDHKLWIFAGYGNVRLNDMWFIQLNAPLNKCWIEVNQCGDQPSTVCNFTLSVIGDSMYLFSGQSGARTSNHLYKFDFKTFNWSKISSNYMLRSTCGPPERRSGHVMVAYDQTLYIYGGGLGNIFFSDLHSFDLNTKTWNTINLSTVPNGRSFMAASVHADYLYIFGGNADQNMRSNELYRFKLPTQPKCTLKDDFLNLFEKEILCDLHFLIDTEIIRAHCAIVACRSQYFSQKIRQIYDCTCENDQLDFILDVKKPIELCLNDVDSPKVFRILLEFIYTDRITSFENEKNDIEAIRLMIDVCKLAERFAMLKLVHICEVFLMSLINNSNVLCFLEYVHSMNMKFLKEYCMKYLMKDANFSQIIMMKEFENLDKSLMVEIVRRRQSPFKSNSDRFEIVKAKSFTSIEEDFESFFKHDEKFRDISLRVDDNCVIKAHKCVLAARCAYFEAYFRSFMPKDHLIHLKIGEISPPIDSCKSLLKYIYYGDVCIPPRDALYLFSASHFFQFTNLRLQVFCTQILEANMTQDNVFDILEAADRIQASEMKTFALKKIVENFFDLAYSLNLEKLSKELLIDIFRFFSDSYKRNSLSNRHVDQQQPQQQLTINSFSNLNSLLKDE